jgi:hypothetical protein
MTRRWKKLLMIPVGLAAVVLFAFLGGQIVRLLWNWLLPSLFGWREITFWQALGLLALCRILFGGLGKHGGGPRMDMRRRMVDHMADRVGERWQRMSPEERERFRQRLRERWGFDPQNSPPA